MEKIKVVWICNFSNNVVRKYLPLSERRFLNFIRSFLGKEELSYHKVDFASWVTLQIIEFEKLPQVELHVISPHYGLKTFKRSFTHNNVNYHFFKPELPLRFDSIILNIFGLKKKKFYINRYLVRTIIKKIHPDIINLIGTENPYYSITALDVRNCPVFVSCQTVYTNPERLKLSGIVDLIRWKIELAIHQEIPYFGCAGRMHRDLILKNNHDAIIFKYFFPIAVPEKVDQSHKEYDFVLFASAVTKQKGVEDAIQAMSIVVEYYPLTRINIVGYCNMQFKTHLLKLIEEKSLSNNFVFHNYFPIQFDMHLHLQKSRFALMPLKLDVISSSIIEAIYLDLPVITYKTSGTPYLNRDGQAVLIAEMNNVEQLAHHMVNLIESPALADTLRKNARAFVDKEFNNTVSAQRLVKTYHAIINHYQHNEPIPEELLFNPEEFPLY